MQTKILMTNLPETVTAREIVGVYLRRWWVELLVKELKGVAGWASIRSPNGSTAWNAP